MTKRASVSPCFFFFWKKSLCVFGKTLAWFLCFGCWRLCLPKRMWRCNIMYLQHEVLRNHYRPATALQFFIFWSLDLCRVPTSNCSCIECFGIVLVSWIVCVSHVGRACVRKCSIDCNVREIVDTRFECSYFFTVVLACILFVRKFVSVC